MKTKWFLFLGILCISGMLSASRYDNDREEEESSGGQNIQEHNNLRTRSQQNNVGSDFYRQERNTDGQGNPNQRSGSDNQDRNYSSRNSNNYHRDQFGHVIAQGSYTNDTNNQENDFNDRHWNEYYRNQPRNFTANRENKNSYSKSNNYTKKTSYSDDDVRYSDYYGF
ncbi:MAG: hypothetical protein H0T62_07660 [Parachlamydiaceae bacterium]|nr:hypothetical protein [Parachlamydiaceae bacterium]